MAYQASTFTGMHDLLDKIRIFLLSNGWAVNLWNDDTSGFLSPTGVDYTNGKRLHIQKTANDGTVMYFNFRSVTRGYIFENVDTNLNIINGRYYGELRGIAINGSTGFNAGSSWSYQPGAPVGASNKSCGGCITELPISGTNNYFIFQNGDVVTVIVEIDTEIYMMLSFGCLQKSGTWTGGQFYSASCCSYQPSYLYWSISGTIRHEFKTQCFAYNLYNYGSSAVYLNLDGIASWRFSGYAGSLTSGYAQKINFGGQAPYSPLTGKCGNHLSNFAYTRCPNDFNGLSVMIPLYVFCEKANSRWTFLGTLQDIRAISMSNYTSAQEFTIEADTWKVFPAHRKEESGITNLNGNVGFAFKKG